MSNLSAIQHRFMDYLLTGNVDPFIQDIAAKGGVSVDVRAQIYQYAYKQRLRETIETDHEMLGLYLGDEMFDAMVDHYVVQHPSQFYSLRDFTTQLPQFLEKHLPFSDYPILAEMARFERLLLDVFDALDAQVCSTQNLRDILPESWPEMKLRLHPSLQFFAADWNSVESWRALKAGDAPDPAVQQPGGQWLLWRGTDRLTQFRSLIPEEHSLLDAALHGANFATLCEMLGAERGEEDAPAAALNYLVNWLENGMITALVV